MQALTTLLEQAERERNAALAAFNQSRARLDSAREQQAQLERYRDEQDARRQSQWRSQPASGQAVLLAQQFGERLAEAIAQQQQAVAVCASARSRAEQNLSAHDLRVASVRKLIERRRAAEREIEQRREVKAADEIAQRMALAQRARATTDPR